MARAILMVMDSFGVGAAPDAADFGDAGADTFGHIVAAAAQGRADRAGLRQGPLELPNLDALGLYAATGRRSRFSPRARFGTASERSIGKDTPSGHWEIAGLPVPFAWGYFPKAYPAIGDALVDALVSECALPGVLGRGHASGTEIIAALGDESVASGKPILYTSVDSVLQIAAHEVHFGLDRLLQLCVVARRHVDSLSIGRVIARPFVDDGNGGYRRSANRRDFAVPPPGQTLLTRVAAAGGQVHGIGKISDIFAGQGIGTSRPASGNMALFDAMLAALDEAQSGDLVFANFIDFDMVHGHRRDVAGYAAALEAFDARLPELDRRLRPGDLAVITADHGCDPTFPGTDHTREDVPILAYGPGIAPGSIGHRDSFADIAESIGQHLGLAKGVHGTSFL